MSKDSQNNLGVIIQDAKTLAGINGFNAYAELISDRRDECQKNGHQLGCTKKEFEDRAPDDTCICMHCDVWLSKSMFEEIGGELRFYDDETE